MQHQISLELSGAYSDKSGLVWDYLGFIQVKVNQFGTIRNLSRKEYTSLELSETRLDKNKLVWGLLGIRIENRRLVWDQLELIQMKLDQSEYIWDSSRQDQINLELSGTHPVKTR